MPIATELPCRPNEFGRLPSKIYNAIGIWCIHFKNIHVTNAFCAVKGRRYLQHLLPTSQADLLAGTNGSSSQNAIWPNAWQKKCEGICFPIFQLKNPTKIAHFESKGAFQDAGIKKWNSILPKLTLFSCRDKCAKGDNLTRTENGSFAFASWLHWYLLSSGICFNGKTCHFLKWSMVLCVWIIPTLHPTIGPWQDAEPV